MSEVTHMPRHAQQGRSHAAEELLPLVYEELRKLAAARIAHEAPGQTLQPTALVHEAWLRLVKTGDQDWQNRGHFFGAAAEAMRRILIEQARRRKLREKGGLVTATECAEPKLVVSPVADEVLSVHEALDRLAAEDSLAAELVKLRYFVGMSMPEAAEVLGMPLRTAERLWTFARAWLRHEIGR
jgi:RNA polymerase sigma factor (TIGR02999 family)